MKATIEFDLPEEEFEFQAATRAKDLAACIFRYMEDLRSRYKYNEQLSEDAHKELEYCRGALGNLVDEYGLHPLLGRY